jgi:anti-sigma regulatory factor (Ser/Thr protein kinase)
VSAAPPTFLDEYTSALGSYLAGGGETGLESAYELGREAVRRRLGLLDLAGVHNSALAARVTGAAPGDDADRILSAGGEFFLESLSVFEMTQRGFREAQETAALQRDIALTLQRNLLPDGLPSLPRFDCAVRYLAGGRGVQVGGDWYEVVELPGDRVGFAVGDVVGRGVPAACVMGQLRIAFRAYALEFASPAVVTRHLGRFLVTLEGAKLSTCLYAVLDPAAGTMEFVNAGHPPPLLLEPGAPARFLDQTGGPPLGVQEDPSYEAQSFALEPGATLLLYTDGLVERRGESIDVGLARLKSSTNGGTAPAEELVQRVVGSLVAGEPDDDVAVLAARLVVPGTAPLELTIEAKATELRLVRRALRPWLDSAGASEEEAYDIVLATCEAAANAIEHAYGPEQASVEVSARLEHGEVLVEVSDRGRWRSPRMAHRGRGLGVMRAAMDECEVFAASSGTTLRLRRRLKGEADG